MNRTEIRDAIESTVEPLSDIARNKVWHRIAAQLDAQQVEPAARPRRWQVPVAFAAGAALAAVCVVALVPLRAPERAPAPEVERVVLSAGAGQRAEHVIAGSEVTLYGPGRLEIEDAGATLDLALPEGVLLARASTPMLVRTPGTTTEMPPGVFAVRVHAHSTEIASGEERARALIDRRDDELDAGAPVTPQIVQHASPRAHESPTPVPSPPPRVRAPVRPRSKAPDAGTRERAASSGGEAADSEPAPTAAGEDAAGLAVSASELYAQAEHALARGDREAATRLLERVVEVDVTGRLAATASYDLARLAFDAGEHDTALRHVERVLSTDGEPNLARPANTLRCRILRATGQACPAR